MSRFTFALAFFFLASASLSSARSSLRECPPKNYDCSTAVALTSSVGSSGKCVSRADAFCSVDARVSACLTRRFVFKSGASCDTFHFTEPVRCVATAIAQAYSTAYSSTICDGEDSFTCATATSDASSLACAVARVIAYISARSRVSGYRCDRLTGNLAKAIANAVTSAQASSCAESGSPMLDFDIQFDYDVEIAIAEVIARCFLGCRRRRIFG